MSDAAAKAPRVTFEVFRREQEGWNLVLQAEGTERVHAQPFDALELDLSRLWDI